MQSKKYGLGLLALLMILLIPVSLAGLSVNLLSPLTELSGRILTYLTHTAGKEGFFYTLALLLLVVLYRSGWCVREWLQRGIQLVVLLALGVVLKTVCKDVTEYPRPYTEAMTQAEVIPAPEHFYRLDKQQKQQILTTMETPAGSWRVDNWKKETDYSFPSGHMVFTAICIAFFGGLLLEQRRYGLAALVLIWGCGIGFSRLWLGMHRPMDLFGGVAMVTLLYAVIPARYPLHHPVTDRWLKKCHL